MQICWTLSIISDVFDMHSVSETELISVSHMMGTDPVSEILYQINLSLDSAKHHVHVRNQTIIRNLNSELFSLHSLINFMNLQSISFSIPHYNSVYCKLNFQSSVSPRLGGHSTNACIQGLYLI